MHRRNSVPILALILCGCLANPDGPLPDDGGGLPDGQTRRAVAEALTSASKEDCLTVYGASSAFARYIDGGHAGIDNTAQLFSIWRQMLDNLGWQQDRYSRLNDAVEAELKQRGFEEPKPMSGMARSASEAFRLIAAGAADAAKAK